MPSPRGTGLVLLAALSLTGLAGAQQGPWVAVETTGGSVTSSAARRRWSTPRTDWWQRILIQKACRLAPGRGP